MKNNVQHFESQATNGGAMRLADLQELAVRFFRTAAFRDPQRAYRGSDYLWRLSQQQDAFLRRCIRRKEFAAAGALFVERHYEDAWYRFLAVGCGHIPTAPAAQCMSIPWTWGNGVATRYALPLLVRHAASLRPTVPSDLPEAVTVYRGFVRGYADGARGCAWTLRRDVAAWFATLSPAARYLGTGRIASGTIPSGDILAYLNDRGEETVLLAPGDVRKKRYAEPTDADCETAKTVARLWDSSIAAMFDPAQPPKGPGDRSHRRCGLSHARNQEKTPTQMKRTTTHRESIATPFPA